LLDEEQLILDKVKTKIIYMALKFHHRFKGRYKYIFIIYKLKKRHVNEFYKKKYANNNNRPYVIRYIMITIINSSVAIEEITAVLIQTLLSLHFCYQLMSPEIFSCRVH